METPNNPEPEAAPVKHVNATLDRHDVAFFYAMGQWQSRNSELFALSDPTSFRVYSLEFAQTFADWYVQHGSSHTLNGKGFALSLFESFLIWEAHGTTN